MTRNEYFYKIAIFISLVSHTLSDDILGCNGFIKSDIDINYSVVEIKLYTKQGNLKDHTDCAPNNGYYFLPIYDKGDYILKVAPPVGWSFDPPELPVTIDGVTDPCSSGKDINFVFKGFSITGQVVSWGHTIGPKGVTVDLFLVSSPTPIQTTTSIDLGEFKFTQILPGSYRIKISHPSWNIHQSEVDVEVGKDNAVVKTGHLSIAGYAVTGVVITDNQPVAGVSFVLFSKAKDVSVQGCDTSALPGFTGDGLPLNNFNPLCHVTSNAKGVFLYSQLSPGDYIIVPHYKGSKSTKFDVHPHSFAFTLEHNRLELPITFQVKGFTVTGKILWSQNGKPMKNANVFVNGKPICKSGNDGVYTLESMKAGNYKIRVEAQDVEFEEIEMKVSSTTLPDLWPKRYRVCGALYSTSSSGPYRVDIMSESGVHSEVSTDSTGSYCLFLTSGKFTISPVVDRAQKNHGLLFSPTKREVEVLDNVLENVNFSQLKSTVKGKIVCMSVCPLITVNLKPNGQGGVLQTIAKNGHYEFKNVMPGDYDVYIEPGLGWCWQKESISFSVANEKTEVPTFTQSGFAVTITSSHSTKLLYYSEGQTNDIQDLHVSPGSTHICVPKASPYIFEPVGCHKYAEPFYRWVTGNVVLTAVTHANTFFIQSSHKIDDLGLSITLDGSTIPKKIIPTINIDLKKTVKYEITLQLREDEVLRITPQASLFLFTPLNTKLKGGFDCINISQPLFIAEKGEVIEGRITTADNVGLGEVDVSITDDFGNVIATEKSTLDGTYKFSPMKPMHNYKIVANKEGFVVTGPLKKGDFSAHKLAEIIVSVKDASTSEYLQGVLLSLSGGKSYRKNAQTNANGTMTFLSLSPGEYFLRPMMKEYKFVPINKMVKVEEGSTVYISLRGSRVAYSAIGQVTSLNGEGEAGVTVDALGLDDCNLLQEEATSTDNGSFRIRGLKPKCRYNVKVKEGLDINHHIQRSIPGNISVTIDSSDVSDLKLYVMRPGTRTDVIVYVIPDRAEDLKTLKVILSREESPDVAVHVVKLSDFKPTPSGYGLNNVVIAMPPLQSDGRGYIIQLESSLSQSTHEYLNRPIHFKARGSFKLFRLPFSPKMKSRDPELSQSSYVILPLILLLTFAYYNKELVRSTAMSALQSIKLQSNRHHSDDSSSEPFVDYPKKKQKSRKT